MVRLKMGNLTLRSGRGSGTGGETAARRPLLNGSVRRTNNGGAVVNGNGHQDELDHELDTSNESLGMAVVDLAIFKSSKHF